MQLQGKASGYMNETMALNDDKLEGFQSSSSGFCSTPASVAVVEPVGVVSAGSTVAVTVAVVSAAASPEEEAAAAALPGGGYSGPGGCP